MVNMMGLYYSTDLSVCSLSGCDRLSRGVELLWECGDGRPCMSVMLVAQAGGAEDLSPALHLQDVQLFQKVLFNKWLSFSQHEAKISK